MVIAKFLKNIQKIKTLFCYLTIPFLGSIGEHRENETEQSKEWRLRKKEKVKRNGYSDEEDAEAEEAE